MKDKIIRNFWDILFPDEVELDPEVQRIFDDVYTRLETRLKIKQKKVLIVSKPKGV